MAGWPAAEPSDLIETWVSKVPNRRALVLGAGGGTDALWLARAGFDVDAVEKDPARARWQIEGTLKGSIALHVEDLATFPIPPGRYGLVVALAVLHFVAPSRLCKVAAGIEAGLCRGGLLMVQVLATDDPGLHRLKQTGAEEVGANTFYVPELAETIHFFEVDELRRLFGGLETLVLEKYRWVDRASDEGFGAGLSLVARRPSDGNQTADGAVEGPVLRGEEPGGG